MVSYLILHYMEMHALLVYSTNMLTYLMHVIHLKLWQPCNNIIDLHFLQLLDVDMAYHVSIMCISCL